MSQVILVSNNDVVNSMYEVNFRAYVAADLVVCDSVNCLLKRGEDLSDFKVFIIFIELLMVKDYKMELENFLTKNNINIPVIILGETSTPFLNSIVIKNKYNIKAVLQTLAKILNVTAQEMASLKVAKYFPIPLNLFSQINEINCDVFLKIENSAEKNGCDYDLVLEKGCALTGFYNQMVKKKINHLYIDSSERLRFINLASKLVIDELDRKDLKISDRIELSAQGMAIVADEIFENNAISAEVAEISKKCIASISTVIKKVPTVKSLLKMLLDGQNDYCYRHSVLNSFIASKIIDKMSWGTPEQTEKVTFALFFHDLYLVPLYKKYSNISSEEDLLFMNEVTDEDKQTVLDHAKLASQLIKTFPRCPMGADQVLIQHHGMANGQGFAINFKDDISPLAKIIIIAEEISVGLITSVEKGEQLVIDQKLIANQLFDKYKNHTYKKIIKAFLEVKL